MSPETIAALGRLTGSKRSALVRAMSEFEASQKKFEVECDRLQAELKTLMQTVTTQAKRKKRLKAAVERLKAGKPR